MELADLERGQTALQPAVFNVVESALRMSDAAAEHVAGPCADASEYWRNCTAFPRNV